MAALPQHFCWTRYGTEAAQTIEQILLRKEQERRANGGLFFWGIGNAIAPSMRELLRQTSQPEVLFSPIKSRPRTADVTPPSVAAWAGARGISGDPFKLPESSLITSRFDPASPRTSHYALVCESKEPLVFAPMTEELEVEDLRNLLTGRPVGASQTTAVVTRHGEPRKTGRIYNVTFRVKLTAPYLIQLSHPIQLPSTEPGPLKEWGEKVREVWESRSRSWAAQQLHLGLASS